MNETENWVPAFGYESLYSVSDLGRVRSTAKRKGTTPGRLLKPRCSKRQGDRMHVILRDGGRDRKWYIHRLVYLSFRGPIEEGLEVDHVNGDRNDNRLANLEAVPRLENMRRAHKMGLMNTANGSRQHRARFTESQVLQIRERVRSGERQVDLAKELGVTPTAINCIVKRHTWRHI